MASRLIKVCFWVEVEVEAPRQRIGMLGSDTNPFQGFSSVTTAALLEKAVAEHKDIEDELRSK